MAARHDKATNSYAALMKAHQGHFRQIGESALTKSQSRPAVPTFLSAPSGFSGRLGLPGWWIAASVTLAGTFLLPRFAGPAPILMEAVLWLWFLAASVRRAHDVDKFGFEALMGVIGVWLLSLVISKSMYSAFPIIAGIMLARQIVPLALDDGTSGPNQYGELTWQWLWVGPARQ